MHKINLNSPLILFGMPIQDDTGKIISLKEQTAFFLSQLPTKNRAKNESIYLRIHDTGELTLDAPDLEFFKECVEMMNNVPDYIRRAIDKAISDAVVIKEKVK